MHSFLPQLHVRLVWAAVVYNVVVFLAFTAAYMSLDFATHFTSVSRVPVSPLGKVYFSVMTHSSVGCGDILPRSDLARVLTGAHATLSWLQVVLIFLAAKSRNHA
jgi:Ion channel